MEHKKQRPTLLIVLAMAWPTMLEQMLQVAAQYVDSAMVGRLGAQAVAAVGATTTISWLVGSSLSALGVGFLAFIAREYGARRYDNAAKAAAQSVLACLIAGTGFIALTLGTDLSFNKITGAQSETADLRHGDIDILGGGLETGIAKETVSIGMKFQDAAAFFIIA